MKKNRIQIQLTALFILLAGMLPAASALAAPLTVMYPNPTADINWSGGTSGVASIQSAFNNARTQENAQLGTSLPMLTLPAQSEWDAKSDGQKALWLINNERIDRSILPLENIEPNVTGVAQTYANFLRANNLWGHNEDGRSPWQRMDANPAIGVCREFLSYGENLAYFATSGSSIPLPIERSVYMWLYDDSGSTWGHRYAILVNEYNDNNGPSGSEGYLGIGRASGPYLGWNYAEVVVMNVFDPCITFSPLSVTSIVRAGATNPTNAGSVSFTVTFGESVTGVDAGDFNFTYTGTVSGASVTSVSSDSGATRAVTVNTGSGSGSIRLDLIDNNTIISAADSKPLGGAGAGNGNFTGGETYTIDKTAPTVTSVNRAAGSPTNAASVNFTVTFSESVTGVNESDFTLTPSGVTGATLGVITGSGATYTVPVNTGSGDGTIRLDVVDNDSILDVVSNPINGGFTAGQVYTIDKTAPETQINSAPVNPSNNVSPAFTFSSADGSATFECSLDGGAYAACGSPKNYSGLVDGAHTFNARAKDSAGNVDSTPAAHTWTVDTLAPDTQISSAPASLTNSASADFTFSSADGAAVFECSLDNGVTYAVCVSPKNYAGLLNGAQIFKVRAKDLAGNVDATPAAYTWTIDLIAPTVQSILRAGANNDGMVFQVSFSEPVTGVDASDFSPNPSGGITGAAIRAVSGSGKIYFVTVFAGIGEGEIRLDVLDDNSITDAANNPLNGGFSGSAFFVKDSNAYYSNATHDGWLLESSETSSVANQASASGKLQVGDNKQKRQFRSLLSFDTTLMPDKAVISKVTLRIYKSAATIPDPFTLLGDLLADVKKGSFSNNPALAFGDFNVAGEPLNPVGKFSPDSGGWYQLNLSPLNFNYVNLTGFTQFRIRFAQDDNNNLIQDLVQFHSGGDANKPQLIIEYTTP